MKVAYFSPFSPMPSGISDFSEEIIVELKKYMEIDLFSKQEIENEEIANSFKVYNFEMIKQRSIREQYDYLIYQMGNNIMYHKDIADTMLEYPGILELHDFALHHFLAEDTFVRGDYDKYIDIMKYCHGKKGEKAAKDFLEGKTKAPWEDRSNEFTVNKHYIDKAKAVIVHSDMAKQLIKGIRPDVPIISIPLHTPDIYEDFNTVKEEAKSKLGIKNDTIVFGSFGYATGAKRIMQIIEALGRYKEVNNNFHYYIVGKVEHIDVVGQIEKYGLKDNVTVTGFTELDEFKLYMAACDICFNLRYPTQGESSASLHRILGMGKPVIVTNIGAFEEYPDEIVKKVRYDEYEMEDIFSSICELTQSRDEMSKRAKNAVNYAKKNFSIEGNARRYIEFLKQVEDSNFKETYLDSIIDKLMQVGIMSNVDIAILSKKLNFIGE